MGTEEADIQVRERLRLVREGMAEAAYASGRALDEIRLIAVTKFVEISRILPAVWDGITEVGENRAQEFTDKYGFFTEHSLIKHFIGTLQTNKVKYLVGKADLIQSVDREAVLAEVNRIAAKNNIVQPILIEVNIGAEEQKSGILPQALPELLKTASDMPGVLVKGLMCVPPIGSEEAVRPYFARMRELFERMKNFESENVCMQELSMGMSGDYKAAIAEGATYIRVGSAIFGPRNYNRQAQLR